GGRYAAADAVSAAAHIAARSGPKSRSGSRAYAAAASAAHAAAGTESVGSQQGFRKRIAQLVGIDFRDIGIRLNDQRGVHHQLGIVRRLYRRRHKLPVGQLWQLSFTDWRRRAIAAASAAMHRVLFDGGLVGSDIRRDQFNLLLHYLLYRFVGSEEKQQRDYTDVHQYGRCSGAFTLSAVEAPDFLDRHGLRRHFQRRQLRRVNQFLNIAPQRAEKRLVDIGIEQ